MEKEGSAPKLVDFYLGVLDFFAILLPGAIAAGLLAWQFHRIPEKPEATFWAVILTAGYVLGHLLHAIGSVLDWVVYDPLFEPEDKTVGCPLMRREKPKRRKFIQRIGFAVLRYRHCNHLLYACANRQMKGNPVYSEGQPWNLFSFRALQEAGYQSENSAASLANTYQWARAWLLLNSPEARSDLDRIEADSKLFRSLSTLLPVFAVLRWQCWGANPWLPLLSIACALLCIWRYCDLRQKMIRACYLYSIQASASLPQRKAEEVAESRR